MTTRSRGAAVVAVCARLLRKNGYAIHVAQQVVVWRGATTCPRCHRAHPSCGSVPRSTGEDLWGAADIAAVRSDRLLVVQCGGRGAEAAKRAALDAVAWPPRTRTVAVVRDRRVAAPPGALRAWWRVVHVVGGQGPWTESLVEEALT